MKRPKRITRKMLMNCYDEETYRTCKEISREDAFRWLAEANRFFVKIKGINKIFKEEQRLKEMGW